MKFTYLIYNKVTPANIIVLIFYRDHLITSISVYNISRPWPSNFWIWTFETTYPKESHHINQWKWTIVQTEALWASGNQSKLALKKLIVRNCF